MASPLEGQRVAERLRPAERGSQSGGLRPPRKPGSLYVQHAHISTHTHTRTHTHTHAHTLARAHAHAHGARAHESTAGAAARRDCGSSISSGAGGSGRSAVRDCCNRAATEHATAATELQHAGGSGRSAVSDSDGTAAAPVPPERDPPPPPPPVGHLALTTLQLAKNWRMTVLGKPHCVTPPPHPPPPVHIYLLYV
jgi:hypothetical protein